MSEPIERVDIRQREPLQGPDYPSPVWVRVAGSVVVMTIIVVVLLSAAVTIGVFGALVGVCCE